jgi:uncharacterized protein YbjT (DUF2867 family)
VLQPEVGEVVEVASADVRDTAALTTAFRGIGAVAYCLSSEGDPTGRVIRDGITSCLAAMEAAGVHRVVAVSASGLAVDGDDPLTRYLAKPILRRALRATFTDMRGMEQVLRASDAAWTVIRPPYLTNGRRKGYAERRDGNVRWRWMASRADLAAAVVDAVEDPTAVGATISIAN